MIIPYDQLDPMTLRALIEEFVTRDGTDYGSREVSLETRVRQVHRQLARGEAFISYDANTQTCHIVAADSVARTPG